LRRILWVKADWDEPWEKRRPFISAAVEAGADAVVVKPGEAQQALKLGAIAVVASESAPSVNIVMLSARIASGVEQETIMITSSIEQEINRIVSLIDRVIIKQVGELRRDGNKVAINIEVMNKELERAAVRVGKTADFLIVSTPDWRIIPLENLIAELHRADVKVLAEVKDAEEAKVAVETLELGAAGVFLDPRENGVSEIGKVKEVLEKLKVIELSEKITTSVQPRIEVRKLGLVPAEVKVVRPVGMGDRACIDTTSLMTLGEGMLVGSQAEGMFLVHSETLQSEFVAPRPFRVNAGAVHAYVKLPDGKTKYISELNAGDEVLIVNAKGEARTSVIGRVKIERRPMLLVEAEHEGRIFKTLVQNAETINLVTKDGAPISVTKLKLGDQVLVRVERVGRHFGSIVAETILEK
jgi:3-dehydroquinate synthase II